MKRILFLVLILLSAFAAPRPASAQMLLKDAVPKLFPQPSFLPEGADHWLAGSITQEKDGKVDVFRRNYNYFSEGSTRKFDIERKKSFTVSAEIRVYPNFIPAHDFFTAEVAKLDKSRIELAPFGHRAYYSYSKPSRKNPPVYRMIFRSAIFVVIVESEDGFSLMDVAGGIDQIMRAFMHANAEMFLINRLTVTATRQGYEPVQDRITFTDDNVTEVDITGTVFDTSFDPIPNATVTLLETGTQTTTDDNGTYHLTVSLAGDKVFAVKRNIYLQKIGAAERPLFPPRGLYKITMTSNRTGTETDASLHIRTHGDSIIGTFYPDIENRELSYPVTGTMDGETGSFTVDCTQPYASFSCNRAFAAVADESGIHGTFSGTGGEGEWAIAADGYVPSTTTHTLSPEDAALRQLVVDTRREITFPDTRNLEMGASEDEKRYVHVLLDAERLGIDPVRLKSVQLVLTHLPNEQKGSLDIYRYGLSERPIKGRIAVKDAEPVVHLAPRDEPFDVNIDITDAVTGSTAGGILIGPLLDSTRSSRHLFARQNSRYPLIRPRIMVTTYRDASQTSAPETVSISIVSEKAEDVAGNRNSVGGDGEPDIRLTATLPSKGTLTYLEITKGGATRRQWNTNPLDIYPVIAIRHEKTILNNGNGSIDITLAPNRRAFDLFLYRGAFPRGEPLTMRYRAQIDGRWFEGEVTE